MVGVDNCTNRYHMMKRCGLRFKRNCVQVHESYNGNFSNFPSSTFHIKFTIKVS